MHKTSAKIKDDAVESEKIGDNEIITATILDANVTNAKLTLYRRHTCLLLLLLLLLLVETKNSARKQ